jgi:hypothetical protein
MTLVQKQWFMIGLNQGVMAGILASDVPDNRIDKVLATIWPGTNSIENVLRKWMLHVGNR